MNVKAATIGTQKIDSIQKGADRAETLSYQFFLLFLAALAITLLIWVKARNIDSFSGDIVLLSYTLFVTTFISSRLISALFFKKSLAQVLADVPESMRRVPYEPTVTFVVPCKNEEKAIRNTVEKCFAADYPKDKIEVIVINDGSTDNTMDVLRELQNEYNRLVVVDWKENRGKRHGMAEGFKLATGEIIIQLDSDSYIRPEYFRKLIEPFRNPKIGGVCAHADPENADENTLTKMQSAYYFMSFRILKAAESTYGVVFCLSGCSSAYRKDAVLPIIDQWQNEKFLGLPVTWGDDRGLTNWLLKRDYITIYTDEAKATTIVPNNFRQLIKQQIRWKKGWFVNSVFLARFIFKKQPFVAFVYFLPLTIVTLLTPFMAARALIYVPIAKNMATLGFYFFGIFLVASIIAIFYRFVARYEKHWPYIFLWSGLNTVFLSFLLFYALATIQNRKWGTR